MDIIREAAASTDFQPQIPSLAPNQRQLPNCMVALLYTLLTQNPEKSTKHCMEILTGQHAAFAVGLEKALDYLLGFDICSGGLHRVIFRYS